MKHVGDDGLMHCLHPILGHLVLRSWGWQKAPCWKAVK